MSYAFRPVGTGDAELRVLARFLARVFRRGDLYAPRYLRWKYVENPSGAVIGMNAWSGKDLVAHYAVVPIEADSALGRHRAALSLDTATHPAHRGRGLFTRLARETYAIAREQGIREIVGVANAQSAPGFIGRLGFQGCGPLEARLLWRPPRLAAGDAAPSWRRVWPPEALRWRAENPQARYGVETRSGTRSILAPTGWPGVRAVLRMEPAEGAVELPGLEPVRRVPLRLWIGRSALIRAPRAGGLSIPQRLRPSPLELIHLPLSDDGPLPDPEGIHFEAFDFDAY